MSPPWVRAQEERETVGAALDCLRKTGDRMEAFRRRVDEWMQDRFGKRGPRTTGTGVERKAFDFYISWRGTYVDWVAFRDGLLRPGRRCDDFARDLDAYEGRLSALDRDFRDAERRLQEPRREVPAGPPSPEIDRFAGVAGGAALGLGLLTLLSGGSLAIALPLGILGGVVLILRARDR